MMGGVVSDVALLELDPEMLVDSSYQPRLDPPTRRDVEELMVSIDVSGQMQPITVVPSAQFSGKYECLFGRRRWFAIKYLNEGRAEHERLKVMAMLKEHLDDVCSRRTSVTENLHRKDLSAYELAVAIRDYSACKGCGYEQAAGDFGVPKRTAYRLQGLLKASEGLLQVIKEQSIAAKPAEMLVRLEHKNPKKAKVIAERIAQGKATSLDIEKAMQETQKRGVGEYAVATKDVEFQSDTRHLRLKLVLPIRNLSSEQSARACEAMSRVLRHLGISHLDAVSE